MKFTTSTVTVYLVAISMCLSLVSAQFFGFGGSPNSIATGDFGGPSAFAGINAIGGGSGRDPRTDRGNGPVVFPPSPPDAPEESSGVVIGGSGFGFVPGPSKKKPTFHFIKQLLLHKKKMREKSRKKSYILIKGRPEPGKKYVRIHPKDLTKYLGRL